MSYYQNSYSAGDTFIDYSGNKYTVVTGGNTPSTQFDSSNIVNNKIVWGDLELTALNQDGGSGISTWTAGTQYSIGDNVIKDNILYQCTTANSDSIWTPANWQKIGDEVFTGATSSTNGEEGIVPQPTTNDISKFLCGDGTWKSASSVPITSDVLWSGTYNSVSAGDTITMSNNYTDYDEIVLIGDGQAIRSLVPSLGSAMGYDNDGGSLGSTFEQHFVITFSGNTCNTIIWRYGSSVASSTMCIVGIKRTVTNGAYIGKSLLWSGVQSQITSGAVLNLTGNYTDYDLVEIVVSNGATAKGHTSFYSSYNNAAQIYFNEASALDKITLGLNFNGSNATVTFREFGSAYADVNMNIYGIKFLPNPNDYSTDEQEIGTWVDGKPLYQRTFTGTTGSGNIGGSIDCTALGIDKCIDISGYIQNTNGGFAPINYNNNTVCTATNLGADKIIYLVVVGNIFSNCPYSITIKYTKV